MDSDVTVVVLDDGTTAQVTDCKTRLHGLYIVHGAVASTIVFRDGGAGGAIKFNVQTVGTTVAGNLGHYIGPFPKNGILFKTNMHVTSTGNNGFEHQFFVTK